MVDIILQKITNLPESQAIAEIKNHGYIPQKRILGEIYDQRYDAKRIIYYLNENGNVIYSHNG